MYDNWQYFFNSTPHSLENSSYRIFEPEWKAEILHWFSREDVTHLQKDEFIKALVNFQDNCGEFYRYRAYFLAAEALAYLSECSLGDEIVSQVLKWSYAYFWEDKGDWKIYPQLLIQTARDVLEKTDRQRVVAAFVKKVHTTESQAVMRVAAEKLGELEPGNKSAIAALLLLMQKNQDEDRTYYLVRSLERIGIGNETVITELIHLMQTTLNKNVCIKSLDSLSHIANGNQAAINALVDFLQINQGDEICYTAARALWEIDPGNVATINSFIHILETTQNINLLSYIASHLAEISPANQAAIIVLSERLESTESKHCLLSFAENLAKFEPNKETLVRTLSRIIETSEDYFIQRQAALQLLEIDLNNSTAISALSQIDMAYFDVNWIYLKAAKKLLTTEPSNTLGISTILQLLEKNVDNSIRLEASEILLQTDEHRQKAIDTLLELAQLWDTCEPPYMKAIALLDKIDPTHQLAIKALNQVVETIQDEIKLMHTVRYLQQLEPNSQIAKQKLQEGADKLIGYIQSDEEKDFCDRNVTYFSNYQSSFLEKADCLKEFLQHEDLSKVVIYLKDYLEKFYKNSSYRYEPVYNIIWHCAQNMTYPEFYKAWHN
jgi:hypothetical protein